MASTSKVKGGLDDLLDAAVRERLRARMKARTLAAGEVLVREGEPSEALFAVRSGELLVSVSSAGGELEVARLGPGHWVGEVGVLDAGPAAATVRAGAPSEVLALSAAELEAILDDDPDLARPLLHALCGTIADRLRSSNRGVLRASEGAWTLEQPAVPAKVREGWVAGVLKALFGGTEDEA